MWPFPAIGPDYSQEQGVLFKRQSTCELEGDSTVDGVSWLLYVLLLLGSIIYNFYLKSSVMV